MYTQQAIIFTKDNAQLIADQLTYYTAKDLLSDYDHMFTMNRNLVLVRDVMDDGTKLLSHVVATSMFFANAKPVSPLTDDTFTDVVQL